MKRHYLLLNWKRVRLFQIQIAIGSAVLFVVYGAFLVLYCQALEGFSLALLMLSTQIGVGLVSTRYYQTIGSMSRQKLTFLDPSELAGDWIPLEEESDIDGVARLFESLQLELQDVQAKTDDVLDLAWFVVIVWSAISTAAAALVGSLPFLCESPAIVLAGLSALCYYDGYKSGTTGTFSEDLDHLEHLACSRISAIQAAASGFFSVPFVRWMSNNQSRVLTDIGVYVLGRSLEESDAVISYSVGFSPNEIEGIEILLSSRNDPGALDRLTGLELVNNLEWSLSKESSSTFHKTVLSNTKGSPNVLNPVTLIKSPSEMEKVTLTIAKAIETILGLLNSSR
ncbi:MAG: hypothetical protein ACFE8Z_01345 [Candidatus Hermodarchaeota archaeon]